MLPADHKKGCDRMIWDGMESDGMGWDEMGWDEMTLLLKVQPEYRE